MPQESLKYLSLQTADNLRDSVRENLQRYTSGDFTDLVEKGGWSIDLSLRVDLDPLRDLAKAKDADAEIENTILVWRALSSLPPSLACENRLWTRLTHVECLEYARARWLDVTAEDDQIEKRVVTHFFASSQTRYRDDNAISRLWWNAFIAKLAAPDNHEAAIRAILKTADIRSNFIERPRTSSRPVIGAAIVKSLLSESWLTEKEIHFREFMKVLNRLGGGKVFEFWSSGKVDDFITRCLAIAQHSVAATGQT